MSGYYHWGRASWSIWDAFGGRALGLDIFRIKIWISGKIMYHLGMFDDFEASFSTFCDGAGNWFLEWLPFWNVFLMIVILILFFFFFFGDVGIHGQI